MLVFAISYIIPLFFILFSKHSMGLMHQIKNINIPSKKMFAFAGSLFIVGSFSLIGQYLIKIVVSHELGIIWQGYYDVSLTLSSILVFAQGTMSYISIPEATNSNRNAIYEKGGFGDVTRGLLALMMFLLIILYFYSGYIIDKIFSKDYVAASDYVFILAIGYLFLFVQSFLVNLNLSFAKNAKEYISTTLLALLLLPLFYFMTEFLITLFKANGYGNGFIGAYLSFTLILMLYTVLTIYYSKDLSPLGILLHKLDKLIISFMISFIIIYLLNHYFDLPTLIGMVISGIIFCFLIFSTGYLKISLFLEMFRGSKG
jgi:O-antigen/teichoic acid export membrane protein